MSEVVREKKERSGNVHYIKPTMTAKHPQYYNAKTEYACIVCVCQSSNLLISIN